MFNMAIIGFGSMAGWHQKNLEKKLSEIKVTGVFDLQDEQMEKAKALGLKTYQSANELLQDDSIDIVLVATPNNFHKKYVIDALNAGKNVICEKPVAMTSAELSEMINAQSKSGKLFSIHQNRRWDKDFVTVKQILQSKEIGTPYFIESRVLGSRGAMHGWRSYKINGGGMLLDWGVHLIDQALELIPSKVVSVEANLQGVFSKEVDDSIKVVLRFENSVSYCMEMSTNCFINQPRWHISCTQGTAIIKNWDCEGELVKLKQDSEMQWDNDIVYTSAGPTRTMAQRPVHTTQHINLPEIQSDSIAFYENIVGVLKGECELIVTPQQALRVMKIIDTAFLSNEKAHGIKCEI